MVTATLQQTEIPTWVAEWFAGLQPATAAEVIGSPETTAVFSTDMILGFCREGPLASERVGALEAPVRALFELAYEAGVRDFVLTPDHHDPHTPEFEAWPVHCVRGSIESQIVPTLSSLPFAHLFIEFPKNSLSQVPGTPFFAWLEDRPDLRTAIAVGNCTDLCVYQLAMALRLHANAFNIQGFQVIVPANCVDTFDLPPEVAARAGAFAHPGEFYHQVFLHHMALNGVRVVSEITRS